MMGSISKVMPDSREQTQNPSYAAQGSMEEARKNIIAKQEKDFLADDIAFAKNAERFYDDQVPDRLSHTKSE